MKHIVVALTVGAVVAGCASDATIRSRPPLKTYTSSKAVDDAVACLMPELGTRYSAGGFSNTRFVGQVIVPGREYDIVPSEGMTESFARYYVFTVNVKAAGKGSTISVYQGQAVIPSLSKAIKDGVEACL